MKESTVYCICFVVFALTVAIGGGYSEYAKNQRIKACEARGHEWRNVSDSKWVSEFTCVAPAAKP